MTHNHHTSDIFKACSAFLHIKLSLDFNSWYKQAAIKHFQAFFPLVSWRLWCCCNLQRSSYKAVYLCLFVSGRGQRKAGGKWWWISTRRSQSSWGSSWRRLPLWPPPRSYRSVPERLVIHLLNCLSDWNRKRALIHLPNKTNNWQNNLTTRSFILWSFWWYHMIFLICLEL